MEMVINIFLHLDKYLAEIIKDYGMWTYLIMFIIVFCETGFVVTPFLPGDSLLFAAGTLAAFPPTAEGKLNILGVMLTLSVAAILGDTLNYWIGNIIGPKIFHKENVRFLNKKHLERTHAFLKNTVENHHHCPVRSGNPHLCPLRGWHRQHELPPISPL